MQRTQRFFETPLFLVLAFSLAVIALYFAFDVQGEVQRITLTERYAIVSMGDKGGVGVFEFSKAAEPKKQSSPADIPILGVTKRLTENVFVMKNVKRLPRLLLAKIERKSGYDQSGVVSGARVAGDRLILVNPLVGVTILETADWESYKKSSFAPLAGAVDVQVDDNQAIVAAGRHGVFVFDISRVGIISLEKRLPTSGPAEATLMLRDAKQQELDDEALQQAGLTEKIYTLVTYRRFFAAAGKGGVSRMEIYTDQPDVLLDPLQVPGEAHALYHAQEYLYIASGKAGICVYKLPKADEPDNRVLDIQKDCLETRGEAFDVTGVGDRLYVAEGRAGVGIYSLAENPARPAPLGRAEAYGKATRLAARGQLLFVGAGDWGVMVFDAANPKEPVLRWVIETPGEADPPLLIAARFDPLFDTPKIAATWGALNRKILVMSIWLLAVLPFMAQFVLPIREGQRWQALRYLLYFVFRRLEAVLYVENGRLFGIQAADSLDRAKIVYLDRLSAALARDENQRVRVLAPGVAFLHPGEQLICTADLRVQNLIYGPALDEQVYAAQAPGESQADYEQRVSRGRETNAWTKDDVEITATLVVEFRLRRGPNDSFDPLAAYRLMTSQASSFVEGVSLPEPATYYQGILERILLNSWRTAVRSFTFDQLFDAAVTPQNASPLDDPPTGWLRLAQRVQQDLTQPQFTELGADGLPTGNLLPSPGYQNLVDNGLEVLAVHLLNPQVMPLYEGRLSDRWVATWRQRAEQEKAHLDQYEAAARQAESARASWKFGEVISKGLLGRILGYGGMVEQQLKPAEAAELLLEDTAPLQPGLRRVVDALRRVIQGS